MYKIKVNVKETLVTCYLPVSYETKAEAERWVKLLTKAIEQNGQTYPEVNTGEFSIIEKFANEYL